MPRPRAKHNPAEKHKHEAPSSSTPVCTVLSLSWLELSKDEWDEAAETLCHHLNLPDLKTRSGLKKVYHDFSQIYTRIDEMYNTYKENHLVRGGIIAIYVKMCADSILGNMLFSRGLLDKIIGLTDNPDTFHLALKALATISKQGGSDMRKEISLQAPVIIKILRESPDDLYAAEMAISTLAHASTTLTPSIKPAEKYIKAFQISELVPLVLGFVDKRGATLPLLHYALELFGRLTLHCSCECLVFPDMIGFLIACTRSADTPSRFYALRAVMFLSNPAPEKFIGDALTLVDAMISGLPQNLEDLLLDYGFHRCDSVIAIQLISECQKAMMQCKQDRDLYKLGLKLAHIIPRNEHAICEGSYQTINKRTGKAEHMSLGLPFKMWTDALPFCAKAIREQGKADEWALADVLDMKYFILRTRASEAVAIAKQAIERDPKFYYPYYIMTFGEDEETGLRYAKKGLKCKDMTPFVNHALRARAVELAGNLAFRHMQMSAVDSRKWEEGQAFAETALEDAQIYLATAPPDMRHRRTMLCWVMVLTLAKKGPELSLDLREFEGYFDQIKVAHEFLRIFGTVEVVCKSRHLLACEHIASHCPIAMKKWGGMVMKLDSDKIERCILSRDKAEDRLAVWLNDIHDDNKNTSVKKDPTVLYRCSWCESLSAVLRKCRGCEKARYCDTNCQKMAWPDHKAECRIRKVASSSTYLTCQ